jgi:hypothetical protein
MITKTEVTSQRKFTSILHNANDAMQCTTPLLPLPKRGSDTWNHI